MAMALFAVVGRATSTRAILAGRAVSRTSRIQRSFLPRTKPFWGLLSRETPCYRIRLPFNSVATFTSVANTSSSDGDLLRVMEEEIKCAEECDEHDRVADIPEGFPFEIQDKKGMNTITLKRNYHGESIEVLISMPSIVTGEDPENDRRVGDEEERERPSQSSIPLIVNVTKNEGHGLEFCCTAYPDELVIDSMSFRENKESDEEMLAYEGPDFSDLDENLQKSFHKYLEMRGISAMTTNFLHEYMINKDSCEYLFWLMNLKKLIEK
ncbi:Uncharacterized protein AXF42_Ash004975 [Apostasia shenzhenica]|uniref:Mitochondrial glycoprotein n=1 Tax=Apostasia shenzhenica TaxID=1088818 RepID=A0A2I0B838_9ASPA|nr:Uncharacterized protein AXF42_Ash004975 [Apostasia shenzhenica]